jgi:UDP-glucose 4-epimerase
VFHLAALRITQCVDDPRLAHDVLATGTLTVLEAARDCGVAKVIASSSASVYGMAGEFPTREDHHPWSNDTIYGAAKAYNEGLLASFATTYGLPYVALRYFNVYGPRMDAHGRYTEVLIRWMERIDAGLPPLIEGDGLQTMDFVDVRDAADANIAAARSCITSGAYNIGRGEEVSLKDLANSLAQAMGRADLTAQHIAPRRTATVARRLADTSAAEADLGFTAQISLREGLEDLVAWWRKQKPDTPQASSRRGKSTSPLVTAAPGGS